MSAGPLKVGDLCVTVNSRYPVVNNGLLVVIVEINPSIRGYRGEVWPYRIRRVDGQVLIATTCRTTGRLKWGKCVDAWCERRRLRRVDDTPDTVDAGQRQLELI